MSGAPGLTDLQTALGLVLVLEGALYALAPGMMKRMFEAARELDESFFRRAGLAALFVGVGIVWMVRG